MSGVSLEFGKDLGIVHEAVVTGRKVGADRKFWSILAHDEEKFKQVVKLINNMSIFEIMVDYSRSLAEMIKAGNYDWVNDDITADRFSVKGEGRQELIITLFHFNKTMSSDKVKSEMEKQGFRPAKVEELLALGEKYPDLQKEFPITALGSVWQNPHGNHSVPSLYWPGVKRALALGWLEGGWSAGWRFAALCK